MDVEDQERLFEQVDYGAVEDEDEYDPISVWDELAESFIREGIISGVFLHSRMRDIHTALIQTRKYQVMT